MIVSLLLTLALAPDVESVDAPWKTIVSPTSEEVVPRYKPRSCGAQHQSSFESGRVTRTTATRSTLNGAQARVLHLATKGTFAVNGEEIERVGSLTEGVVAFDQGPSVGGAGKQGPSVGGAERPGTFHGSAAVQPAWLWPPLTASGRTPWKPKIRPREAWDLVVSREAGYRSGAHAYAKLSVTGTIPSSSPHIGDRQLDATYVVREDGILLYARVNPRPAGVIEIRYVGGCGGPAFEPVEIFEPSDEAEVLVKRMQKALREERVDDAVALFAPAIREAHGGALKATLSAWMERWPGRRPAAAFGHRRRKGELDLVALQAQMSDEVIDRVTTSARVAGRGADARLSSLGVSTSTRAPESFDLLHIDATTLYSAFNDPAPLVVRASGRDRLTQLRSGYVNEWLHEVRFTEAFRKCDKTKRPSSAAFQKVSGKLRLIGYRQSSCISSVLIEKFEEKAPDMIEGRRFDLKAEPVPRWTAKKRDAEEAKELRELKRKLDEVEAMNRLEARLPE